MKKTRRIATWKYIVSLTLSVTCILIALFVELTAANFAIKSMTIQSAENDGNSITHTAYGDVTWTNSQTEAYKNAVKAKEELISTNDVAKFFSDLAGSITGKIVRWLIPLVFVPAWLYISAKFAYAAICTLYGRTRRWWTKSAYPTLKSWYKSFRRWRRKNSFRVRTHLSK